MKSDRWGSRWSDRGVILQFGDGLSDITVPLSPAEALQLKDQLIRTIGDYEMQFGTIWSEDNVAMGNFTDAQLFDSKIPEMSLDAAILYGLIRSLPLQGFERSFKMQAGELKSERFLVGLGRTSLPFEEFEFMALRMGAPAHFRDAMKRRFDAANFVHIGFEQGTNGSTYKLYLEFPDRTAQTSEQLPLYLGYKWNPQDNLHHAISTYTRPKSLDLQALLKRVDATYAGVAPEINRIAADIIRAAVTRVRTDALLFVEVCEEGTPRKSFDINLYATGLRLSDIGPMLEDMRRHCGIDKAAFFRLMERVADDLLGHISGGIDRSGNAFLTAYHKRVTVDAGS